MRELTIDELTYVRGGWDENDIKMPGFDDPFENPWMHLENVFWDRLKNFFRDIFGGDRNRPSKDPLIRAIEACERSGKAAKVEVTRGNVSSGITIPLRGRPAPIGLSGEWQSGNVTCV